MMIAGFKITKTHVSVLAAIAGVIAVIAISNSIKRNEEKEEAKRIAAEEAEKYRASQQQAGEYDYDYDAILQENLRQKYGDPPDGFKWNITGELEAIGSADMTAEDVIYTFLRSLSMLDFSTAQMYSRDSFVADTYQDYYSNYGIEDYYDDFIRKQYKYALTTLEIIQVGDVAVFADGTENISVKLNMIDLSNKDFWLAEKETIFDTLYNYNVYQDDETKGDQYLYDYIYKLYESGSLPKKAVDVEIVLGKDAGGGWLVTNDNELDAALGYDWGTEIASFIKSEYRDYELQRNLSEAMQAR